MDIFERDFKRKFSLSVYKNLNVKLGMMSFTKDFINTTLGDLYPVDFKSEDCDERVENNLYKVEKGKVKRLICQFFPFATYEITTKTGEGESGFCFKLGQNEASVFVSGKKLVFCNADGKQEKELPEFVKEEKTLVVSCRPGAFDIYFKDNNKPVYCCTFEDEGFDDSNDYAVFSNAYAFLYVSGSTTVKQVLSYVDCGVSIADIRPVKYENGDAMIDGGKLFFTASIRMQKSSFQGIFSWIPGTAQIDMTAALFYDCGDGKWRNYLAPVLIYNRNCKQWHIWVSSFEHKHILAYGSFDADVRYGVNVIDVTIMEETDDYNDITLFKGYRGDEDPDLIYDSESGKWLMAICRSDTKVRKYVYVFFESDNPFTNFKYIGRGYSGHETGGSFVKIDGEMYFVCGNDKNAVSDYRIYSKDGMRNAKFNFSDGGFRGWGSVIPIKLGSRTRYFWLTFDRHKGSEYTWSYGNVYCFEA